MIRRLGASFIRLYQLTFSSLVGNCCRFQPTCSEYAKQAILEYGFFKGCYLAFKRLLRCHPFCVGGYDPVPPKAEKGKTISKKIS